MKKLGKLLFTFGLILILTGVVILRKDSIMTLFNTYLSPNSNKVEVEEVNDYYRDYDFLFIQNTKLINPLEYQDILNTYYTVINAGYNEFTFYCPKEYESCLTDVESIANDQTLLSDINNYTHPFNAFSHIETEFDSLGKVTIKITRPYTKKDIKDINNEVDKLYDELYDSKLSIESNIVKFHDYIINYTKYDSLRSDKNITTYRSDIAYGPLFEGYAVCGGYTDLMQLFLEKMNVKSYRVSSNSHIWNAVYLDGEWYHLDLTWDDPVVSDGKDYLNHDYFLIKTKELQEKEKTQHEFNKKRFLEVKEANS